jgi:UDP-glucose 4-epimerase
MGLIMKEKLYKTKALITGGSGFLGSFLIDELLVYGYDITVFDLNPPSNDHVTFFRGNIEDNEAVQRAISSNDVVFHLAGVLGTSYLLDKAQKSVDVNIGGTLNVYDAVKETDKKIVNIGLFPEWDNTYMITKKAAMRFGRMYADIFGVSITTLELTHVYGPKQSVAPYFKAIPTFVTQALANKPLTVFGKGDKWMDLLYVKDAARAIRMAAEQPDLKGHVLAVGSGNRVHVIDLAKIILQMTGSASELVFAPMRLGEPTQDTTEITVDTNVLSNVLGWKPLIGLDDGLLETIDWYRFEK